MTSNDFSHYIQDTWAGKELLKKHSLNEEGTWQIYGEDPNCDMGGSHCPPNLGIHAGKLEDVLRNAVGLPAFWSWGGGGSITKLKVVAVDAKTAAKQAEIRARIRSLEDELALLKRELL